MKILHKPCGAYQTNCYIVSKKGQELIIDPGEGAYNFVITNVSSPLAIFNTHGHFDHIFSDVSLKKNFNIPIYIHKDDEFMLQSDPFCYGYETTNDIITVGGVKFEDLNFKIGNFDVTFLHFPGHTPGCSMIKIDNVIFSGDFLFKNSIGRYDFPFSNAGDMKQSLQKCQKLQGDFTLYPGHGDKTTLKAEQANLPSWIRYFK